MQKKDPYPIWDKFLLIDSCPFALNKIIVKNREHRKFYVCDNSTKIWKIGSFFLYQTLAEGFSHPVKTFTILRIHTMVASSFEQHYTSNWRKNITSAEP